MTDFTRKKMKYPIDGLVRAYTVQNNMFSGYPIKKLQEKTDSNFKTNSPDKYLLSTFLVDVSLIMFYIVVRVTKRKDSL